jgi:hypothetical protein
VLRKTPLKGQAEMAELFGVDVDTVGLHLRNIYREKELEDSTYEESSVVRMEGNRRVRRRIRIYDLDAVIAVGYRVKSRRGLVFRRWANSVLKQYLMEGYALNEKGPPLRRSFRVSAGNGIT